MGEDREAKLFASLIFLADTLASGFDAIDVADRMIETCQDLLPIDASGIMLDDQRGGLRLLAASSDEMRVLELMQLQANEGPCVEAFHKSEVVEVPRLAEAEQRWPDFVGRATSEGFRAAFSVPMRLRDRTIGTLNMLSTRSGPLQLHDLRVAQVLTGMAAIGLINHRVARRQEVLAEQLQSALNSRILIEQAKGVVAERTGVDMGAAFDRLRRLARSSRRSILEVCSDVVDGKLSLEAAGQDEAAARRVAGNGDGSRLPPRRLDDA